MSSLRQGMVWAVIAFGAALAVIVGIRLDQAALAALVGAACGVGASIPTGLLVLFLIRRRDLARETRAVQGRGREMAQPPPVVVVAPSAVPQLPQPNSWAGVYDAPLPAQREFAVIGQEEIEDGFDYWQESS